MRENITKSMMSGVVYPTTCSLNLPLTALIPYLYGFSEEEINGNEQRGLVFPDDPTGFSPWNCLVDKGQAEVFVISPKSPTANSPPLTASEQIPNQPW